MSFDDDLYFNFLSKPSNSPSDSKTPNIVTGNQTPPEQCSPSLKIEIPNFSQEEIAKLWATAFPESQAPTSLPQTQTAPTSPKTIINSSTLQQKRKSASQLPSLMTSKLQQKRKSPTQLPISPPELSPTSKKRHMEEKESPRCSKRSNCNTNSNSRPPKGSKINHNLIEKRYRSSLNDKIALLRDALPRSYGNSCQSSDEDEVFMKKEDIEGEFDGQVMEGKQSTKGAVLSDAARYIRFLEGKVGRLEERIYCGGDF